MAIAVEHRSSVCSSAWPWRPICHRTLPGTQVPRASLSGWPLALGSAARWPTTKAKPGRARGHCGRGPGVSLALRVATWPDGMLASDAREIRVATTSAAVSGINSVTKGFFPLQLSDVTPLKKYGMFRGNLASRVSQNVHRTCLRILSRAGGALLENTHKWKAHTCTAARTYIHTHIRTYTYTHIHTYTRREIHIFESAEKRHSFPCP